MQTNNTWWIPPRSGIHAGRQANASASPGGLEFRYAGGSTKLADLPDLTYRSHGQSNRKPGQKEVKVFYTHGLQVLGIPPELVQALGAAAIQKADGVKTLVSAHFETEDTIYLLRIESLTKVALPG